ncbi:MAG TPA: hypothetical protein VN238_16130, partial [Solirubrobacteraceae bacterium]|nr:hypothetical protein [Solirubrobacteraceae bacterium]
MTKNAKTTVATVTGAVVLSSVGFAVGSQTGGGVADAQTATTPTATTQTAPATPGKAGKPGW